MKYLPSLEQFTSGVIVVVGGLLLWSLVGSTLTGWTSKLTPKTA